MTQPWPLERTHHPWCNDHNPLNPGPVDECSMCPGLYRDHPVLPGDTPDTLMKRHFPNNRRVGRSLVEIVRELTHDAYEVLNGLFNVNERCRQLDLKILWPECCAQAKDLDHAKAAFAVHALHDHAWLALGHDAVVQFINNLEPVGRCPHWQLWDECPVCSH